jgi:hypothetical protein
MCRLKTNGFSLLLILVIAAVLIYFPAIRRYWRIHTM